MPAVFVHGVPETRHSGMRCVRSCIATTSSRCSCRASACARPDGFGATKDEYVDWLVGELERAAGERARSTWSATTGAAGFVVRVVSTRSDLVRTWVTDAAGLGDVDFEWHEFAKIWQTPGEGEDFFAQQLAQPVEERARCSDVRRAPRPTPRTWPASRPARWPTASWPSTDRPPRSARSGGPPSRMSGPDWWWSRRRPVPRGRRRSTGGAAPAPGSRRSQGSATGGCCRTRGGRGGARGVLVATG